MNRLTTLFIALIVVAILGFYMVSFQVRYDEVAVLTTFERAEEPVVLGDTVPSVATVPSDGLLGSDARFAVTIGSGDPVTVTVPASATADNPDSPEPLESLRADVQTALETAGLSETLVAQVDDGGLRLQYIGEVRSAKVAIASANDAAAGSLFEVRTASEGSLFREPGLYFKAPWPFQKVTRYSKRLHVLEDQLQEQQTDDDRSVIVKTFVTWRIDDPYAFFKSLKTVDRAEEMLLGQLASVNGVIGEFQFDELVNADPSVIKLDEIEVEAAQRIREQIKDSGYGVEIESVGIRRLLLPEMVTEKVFERMKSDRNRRAADLLAQGEAEAGRIRKDAESKRERIMAFAEGRAQTIEALGAKEAAESYAQFAVDEEFAIFLRQMQALERMLAFNSTFVFRADKLDLISMFENGPAVLTDERSGQTSLRPADAEGR